jgi:hypothetical protein
LCLQRGGEGGSLRLWLANNLQGSLLGTAPVCINLAV